MKKRVTYASTSKLMLIFFIALSFGSYAQDSSRHHGSFSFNFVTGFQSVPGTGEIDARLASHGFTALRTPNTVIGFEFSVFDGKNILKASYTLTGGGYKESTTPATLQTEMASLIYGWDILNKSKLTYLYPFMGARVFDLNVFGKSADGKQLRASKFNIDFLAGIGLKQFLNKDLRGIINNFDLNAGVSLFPIHGKWKSEGAEYVTGTYQLKTTYFITLSFGRGFRPASVR